ncbi:site-specific DNA-methyltransferase [Prevotella melaninogenica]|uniref:site-specific DNA-methyltransferase n=1 Tax=Prevotella melaninogenica TaxID=28132 RepID=UPI0024327062|nr:site-specific DNA-methyltransferase [Prevotella melaninogenica]
MKPIRLETTSVDGTKINLEALYQIAPSCFTEEKDEKTGEIKRVVNFETLRQLLGGDAVDEDEEMYQFTWPGKRAARYEAAEPIDDTLRPVPADSVDWDTTENLYIEGDNLRVLKLLQRGYMGKVKMIYIDPPYNTGNDFVYHDDFAHSAEEEDLAAGNIDEEGNRYRRNLDSNGRFHSDWCSMMYSRLLVAHSLLKEDGVIFISIDDNEVHNLRKICDEVFGAGNFVAELIWAAGRKNDSKLVSVSHEYILCYVKSLDTLKEAQTTWRERKDGLDDIYKTYAQIKKAHPNDYVEQTKALKSWYKSLADGHPAKAHKHYSRVDDHGIYFPSDISWPGGGGPKYDLVNPETGIKASIPSRGWITSEQTMLQWVSEGLVDFGEPGSVPTKKAYLKDRESSVPYSVFYKDGRAATKRLMEMFGRKVFDNPKDEDIIYRIVNIGTSPDSLILDFFSGSATTAHAVMQLNAEDGGKRKYICVQLPEETPEGSEARKAGYATIPEIAKERIRRAGRKIKEESQLTTQDLDTGFRVFRIDSGNYKNVTMQPNEYDQQMLDLFVDNIKADRTDLDLLFGAMLAWGVQLSLPMTTEEVDGCKIYAVDGNGLVACFAENISENVVQTMAAKQPLRVLFRDSCFDEDKTKINIFERFKQQLDWDEKEAIQNIRVV